MLVIVNLKLWQFMIINKKKIIRKMLPEKENICLKEHGMLG
jgi:hypothetical protein